MGTLPTDVTATVTEGKKKKKKKLKQFNHVNIIFFFFVVPKLRSTIMSKGTPVRIYRCDSTRILTVTGKDKIVR